MTDHYCQFPYEEVRRPDEDYFQTWQEAKDAGYDDDQIWSVVLSEGDDSETWTYGPPHHYINLIGYIATDERHDGETYYHEEEPINRDDEDEEDGEEE
tara:strand:+ start:1143 stop:1436 length:294 start_codon:yes stop_codon:yes gene_type:complete